MRGGGREKRGRGERERYHRGRERGRDTPKGERQVARPQSEREGFFNERGLESEREQGRDTPKGERPVER